MSLTNLKRMVKITLRIINNSDIGFLYKLLKERQTKTFISHGKIPTYAEHTRFVKSKPYSKWYIIMVGTRKVGTIYLTKQNEIGIFVKKWIQHQGIGTHALEILMENNPGLRYLANVSPKNKDSMEFFQKNGFKLIQYTYQLIDSEYT